VDNLLKALATKPDVTRWHARATVKVVVVQPSQSLALCVLTAFRDDPDPALERSDKPRDDVKGPGRGRRLDGLFQPRTQKAGVGRAIWTRCSLNYPAEVDSKNRGATRVRQTPSPWTLPTRASARSARRLG
jgi:hypothetical protein